MKSARFVLVSALVVSLPAVGHGDPPSPANGAPPDAKPQAADAGAKAFVAKHCLECHSGAKPKGDVALDKLTADLGDKANRELSLAAMTQIKTGAMPPEKKPRPDVKDAAALDAWLGARLEVAEAERRAKQG